MNVLDVANVRSHAYKGLRLIKLYRRQVGDHPDYGKYITQIEEELKAIHKLTNPQLKEEKEC